MLSQLSAATSLNALIATISRLDPSDLQSLGNNLQSLRSVTLRARLDDLVNLILACHLSLLNALTIQCLDLAKSLMCVRLEFSSNIGGWPTQTLIQYLEPLLSLPKVASCDLIFHMAPPSISDGNLIRLGDAWPNLQRLNARTYMTGYSWHDHIHGGHGHWAQDITPDIQHPIVCGLMELTHHCPALRYVHLVTLDAAPVWMPPHGSAALTHPCLWELLVKHVLSTKAKSLGWCAITEMLNATFPGLDISLSKAECAFPNLRPEWEQIMLLMHGLRYRHNPYLAQGAHACMAAGARFAASRKSLVMLDKALSDAEDGDPDREWDLDLDSEW